MEINKCILGIFLSLFSFSIQAQQTLTLSRAQSEAVFLQQNLFLLAEKLQISRAEAMVMQARLWPNPNFAVDEVNLWATERQLAVFGDELQGFNGGSVGKNQQFSFALEQLVETAGKRKKRIALEEVGVDQSVQEYEELLRNLKLEFRNKLTQLQYLQSGKSLYQSQLNNVKKLTQAYQKQLGSGNISQAEFIRLKALELEISKSANDLLIETNEVQQELKLLMHIPAATVLVIEGDGFLKDTGQIRLLNLGDLLNQGKLNRPDYKISQLNEKYFSRQYELEKAQKVPDVTFSVGYDRGGNFMYNFVGFGLALDLPVFNRNQGAIKSARIGVRHAEIMVEQMSHQLDTEIVLAYQNLQHAVEFQNEIETGYEATLDSLLESFTKNFTDRNISLLEYLDYLDAYLENKKIILEAGREVSEKSEELNSAVGVDIIK